MLFPQLPRKTHVFWKKSGISWEKVRRRKKRELKSKEKGKNHFLSPKKSLIFSQRWEKSWESWEKSPTQHFNTPNIYNTKNGVILKAE